jgi:8-oxo-dGTP pyrophosphatase MutT (NUDIX family)
MEDRVREMLKLLSTDEDVPLSRNSAAVAVLFKQGGEGPELLLIKRVSSPNDPWSGQISFTDKNLMETALRELEEETGISREAVSYVTAMRSVSPRNMPSLKVKPYMFTVEENVEANPGPEVSKVFWTPLNSLRRRVVTVYSNSAGFLHPTLCYVFGDEVVWGMTAVILRRLTDLLQS